MYKAQPKDPLIVLLLTFITCGIYGLVWLYEIGDQVNKALNREAVKPVYVWLGIVCFPVLYYYIYTLDLAMIDLGKERDVNYTSNFVIWLITMFIGIGLFICEMQGQTFLNQVWEKQ